MKRLVFLFLTFLSIQWAHSSTWIGGLYYNLDSTNKTAEVTYLFYNNSSNSTYVKGNLVIPETVVYGGTTYSVTSIGNYAFYECTGLTSVTIPNSVTSIEEGTFYQCSGLTSVEIPNSVTSIGYFAFIGCSGLTSITIPNSVTSIGSYAFYQCSGLTSVAIPNSVTSIGSYAFYECTSLTSLEIPNSVTSIGWNAFDGCSGLTGELVIPNSVTSIESYTFSLCTSLTSVEIPNSVTSIEEGAFYQCSGLTSVVIPNSVASIGDWAFWHCSGLTEIRSLAEIPPKAYSNSFYDYSIPVYVPAESISLYKVATGWENFKNISPLVDATSIKLNHSEMTLLVGQEENLIATLTPENAMNEIAWSSENDKIAAVDNAGNVFALTVGNTIITAKAGSLIATCKVTINPVTASSITLNIHEMGLAIGQKEKLLATVYPENTTNPEIIWHSDNEAIATVSKDGTVSALSDGTVNITATCGTAKATCIVRVYRVAPGSVTIDGISYNYNGDTAVVAGCASNINQAVIAGKINIPFGGENIEFDVVGIADNAFANNTQLLSVVIPSSITSIGANAFANCTGLQSVICYASIPPACSSNTFTGTKCEDLHVPYTSLSAYQAAAIWKNFKNIYGDLGLYEYNKMSFWLDPQSLQGELVSIDKSLDKVDIPEQIIFEGNTYPIAAIAEGAFEECENISAVTIPSSISIINANIFDEIRNLKNLTFSDGSQLLYINGKIIASNLEILTIGRELYFGEISIDGEKLNCSPVFANYSALTSLNFGKNIKTIIKGMFEGCNNLRSITIPENVEFIGDKAFNGCVSLRSINLEDASNPIIIESATSGTGTGTTFGSAPIETIYLGRNVEYIGTELSPFKNLETLTTLTIGNKTTSINNYLFYGCRNIEMMSVPSSVTYIGGYSFYDCSAAKLLTISRSVETIGEYAFYNCRSLNTLTIPSSVVTIGDYAFRSCSGLTSISIGDGVKTIGNYAFLDCYMASSISIGNAVQSIGENAFYNCQSWTNIVIPNSVVTIGANAFALCQGADEITIGMGVKSIGERAFADCDFITKVSSLSSVPPVAYNNSFTSYDATLYVPENALDLYKTSTCWKNFKTIINDLPIETPATGITLTPSTPTELKVGESLQLTATVSPENTTDKSVTWQSSDSSVATINQLGLVTAIAPGTAVITASDAYGHNAMVTVTVKADDTPVEVPATGISIIPSTPEELKVGENKQFTATLSPENASNKTVTWESSDSGVATVNDHGLVTGVAPGTAVITASDAYGHNAFVIITVIAAEDNGVETLVPEGEKFYILTMDGILVKKDATQSDIDALAPGIYIRNGKKVIVK